MNTLWMVIYFAGKVAAVVGPLDYTIAECNTLVGSAYDNRMLDYTTDDGVVLHGVKYSCEFHDTAPLIGTSGNN
jgi:hypothetical protein